MKAKQVTSILRYKEIEKRVAKRFASLMIEFLNSIGSQDVKSEPVRNKLSEVNQKWVEYCDKHSFILPAGKLKFMELAEKHLSEMPPVMQISRANDSPAGTT